MRRGYTSLHMRHPVDSIDPIDRSTARSARDILLAWVGRPLTDRAPADFVPVAKTEECASDVWLDVVNQALAEGLGPLLSHQLDRAKAAMPAEIHETLRRRIAIEQIWSGLRAKATVDILHQLQASGIDARAYKGQPLAQALYGDATLKSSCDIDIIVSRSQISAAATQLDAMGYVSGVSLGWFKSATFLKSQKECAFSTMGGALCVDLHWGLVNRWNARPALESELFELGPTVVVTGATLPWFNLPLLWRIQLGHLASSDWRGLKTFVDFVHLTDQLTDDELSEALLRCHELGASTAALAALAVISELFGRAPRPVPAIVERGYSKARAAAITKQCVARLRTPPLQTDHRVPTESAWARLGAHTSLSELMSSFSQLWTPATVDFELATPAVSQPRLVFRMLARRAKKHLGLKWSGPTGSATAADAIDR